ncbi:sulfur carrier protein ThiS [Actinomycetes bacterium KLBMP 9759]
MDVWINGDRRRFADGATVREALAVLDAPERGIAVAVDGEVVPRAAWAATPLVDGARVEVLTAVQGG